MQIGASEEPLTGAARALRYNNKNNQKFGDINIFRLKD